MAMSCQKCGAPFQRVEQRDVHHASCTGPTITHHAYTAPPKPQHRYKLPICSSDTGHFRDQAATLQRLRFGDGGRSSTWSTPSPITCFSDSESSSLSSRRPSAATIIAEGKGNSRVTKKRSSRSSSGCRPHQCVICEVGSCVNDDHRKNPKKFKEQRSRKGQASRFQDLEDLTYFHIQYEGEHQQNPANANSAGLRCNKIEILDNVVALFEHFLRHAYIDAIKADRLEDWQAEMNGVLDEKRKSTTTPTVDPLKGSLIIRDLFDSPCDHKKGEKACITHDQPDWRLCREKRRRDAFKFNVSARINELPLAMRVSIQSSASWQSFQNQISE